MKRVFYIWIVVASFCSSCSDDYYYDIPFNNVQEKILVDASHDGGVWWFPQSIITGFSPAVHHQGKALVDLLKTMGFQVDELPSYIPVTDSLLSLYKRVIRAGCYGNYLPSELAAYTNFLNKKSSLLLISEFRHSPSDIDQLAEGLGIQFRGSFYDSVMHYNPHPITAGAVPFYYNAGAIVINDLTNPNIQVLGKLNNTSRSPVMGILNHPKSKIFFIGEINGLESIPQPFTSQLMKWLFF